MRKAKTKRLKKVNLGFLPGITKANKALSSEQATQSVNNLKTAVIYGGIGLLVVGGTAYLAYSKLQGAVVETKRTNASKNSVDSGSPEYAATRFRMAFENDNYPGTNVDEVYAIVNAMPSQSFYQRTRIAYKNLYNGQDSAWYSWNNLTDDLAADLKDELSSSEYNKFVSILNSKPE